MDELHARTRRPAALLMLVALGLLSGCVERRYTIRSDPPGATVIVNGEEIGPTPASKSFYYYGNREITLMLDGYQTRTVIQPINAPWWDNYVTEFFTENIVPVSLRDEREYTLPARAGRIATGGRVAQPSREPARGSSNATQAAARGHSGMARILEGVQTRWGCISRTRCDPSWTARRNPFAYVPRYRPPPTGIDRSAEKSKLRLIKPTRLADLLRNETQVPTSDWGERQ